MARDVKAGGAYVELGVRSNIDKGLRQAADKINKWGKGVGIVGATIGAAGTSVLAPMVAATKSFASTADSIGKTAVRLGVGTEQLSQLGFAAEQSGTSLDVVAAAMQRANRRIANWSETGAGPAKRALDELGVSAESLAGKSPIDQMMQLADTLKGVENAGLRNQYAFEIFGDSAKAMIPLLSEGLSLIHI